MFDVVNGNGIENCHGNGNDIYNDNDSNDQQSEYNEFKKNYIIEICNCSIIGMKTDIKNSINTTNNNNKTYTL